MDWFIAYFIGTLVVGTLGTWLFQALIYSLILSKLVDSPILSRLLSTLAGFAVMSALYGFWYSSADGSANFASGMMACFLGLCSVGYFQLRKGLDEKRARMEAAQDAYD